LSWAPRSPRALLRTRTPRRSSSGSSARPGSTPSRVGRTSRRTSATCPGDKRAAASSGRRSSASRPSRLQAATRSPFVFPGARARTATRCASPAGLAPPRVRSAATGASSLTRTLASSTASDVGSSPNAARGFHRFARGCGFPTEPIGVPTDAAGRRRSEPVLSNQKRGAVWRTRPEATERRSG
jgi:hypothetical protein